MFVPRRLVLASFAVAAIIASSPAALAQADAPQADETVSEDVPSPTDDAVLAPDATADRATEAEAPAPLDGPLRPKGEAPARPSRAETRIPLLPSLEGGLRWKSGDAAVTLSGTPSRSILGAPSSIRLGATIAR